MARCKKKSECEKDEKPSKKGKITDNIKKAIPDYLLPENFDKEEMKSFFQDLYEKSAKMISIGAKKVGETSEKLAETTKLYYILSELKVKLHLAHAKLGETVEASSTGPAISVAFSDAKVKRLLDEIKTIRAEQNSVKEKLAKINL